MKAEIERGTMTAPSTSRFFAQGMAHENSYIGYSLVVIGSIGVAIGGFFLIIGLVMIGFVVVDFFKTQGEQGVYHTVSLTVQFTEEEKQIIRDAKIENTIILARELDRYQEKTMSSSDKQYAMPSLTFSDLMSGEPDVRHFQTPINAKAYEAELEEKLPDIKGYIDGNIADEGGKKTFDL